MSNKAQVSIVVLTRNAQKYLDQLLKGVYKQTYKDFEILVIDSKSSDRTIDIIKKYPVKLISIDPKDFGHGKTRNYGARLANGKIVVYLTHDAIPRNTAWLTEIIKPLENNKVAGVFARQIARNNAIPMEKFFYYQMYPKTKRIWTKNNLKLDEIIFSNASSAVKKHFILSNPFPEDILMSEDREWGINMVNKGYEIHYEPKAIVTHSHNTKPKQLFQRYFDFGISHENIDDKAKTKSFLNKGLRLYIYEFKYLITKGYIQWLPYSIIYNSAKFFGLFLGKYHNIIPVYIKVRISGYGRYLR